MNEPDANPWDDHMHGYLYEENLKLVIKIAESFENLANNGLPHSGLELDRLVEQGNVGLLLAAERFDPNGGFEFSNYATWWIRHAIFRSIIQVGAFRNVLTTLSSQEQFQQWSSNLACSEGIALTLQILDGRERTLLGLRFGLDRGGEPLTLEEVSDHFRWTRERVRQVESRSISKILHFELIDLRNPADRLTYD